MLIVYNIHSLLSRLESLLLSLVPPSCMVVLNREIANLNTSSLFSAMSNPHEPNTIPENI